MGYKVWKRCHPTAVKGSYDLQMVKAGYGGTARGPWALPRGACGRAG